MRKWQVPCLLATLLLIAPGARADLLSANDQKLYRQAFDAAHGGHYDQARQFAGKAHDPLLATLLQWINYEQPNTTATFDDIAAFIRDHPTWPDIPGLARHAEALITPQVSATALRAWFAAYPPQSLAGVAAYAQALLADDETAKAADLLRATWINYPFDADEDREFLAAYRQFLRPDDDWARMDRLLWDRDLAAAARESVRIPADRRALAAARLALINGNRGAEALIDRLSPADQSDPGLLYDHVRYLRERNDDRAYGLLLAVKGDPGRPELWWNERANLARTALRTGNPKVAYDIVNGHGEIHDGRAADAVWMAGWIALRFMNDAPTALARFSGMYASVTTPVSQARAAYWAGRAAEAVGKGDDARHWYDLAAAHGTTFYGQLAASKLGRNDYAVLAEDPLPSEDDIASFDDHELVRLVREMAEVGERAELPPFLLRIGTLVTTPGQRAMAAELATRLSRPDVAVTLARRSEKEGVPLLASGYPVLPLPGVAKNEQPLVLGIIRQESAFHEGAISTAGARGLMQLMPATAAKVAHTLKLIFKRKTGLAEALNTDPGLNIRLGTAYLNSLLADFNGSYVLAIAAYNAGPGRAADWAQTFGDPRAPKTDIVDWIESIPFGETRDYVERVLEGTQVYRQRLGTGGLVLSEDNQVGR